MGNRESQREAGVFIDVTTAVRLAHSREVRQTQGLTGAIDASTDVFSESREQTCMGAQKTAAKTLPGKRSGY